MQSPEAGGRTSVGSVHDRSDRRQPDAEITGSREKSFPRAALRFDRQKCLTHLNGVKSVTHREFFRTPDLLNELKPGEVLQVTRAGQVSFLAIKPGPPRRLSTAELARQAAAGRPFDGTAFLRQQRT